MTVLADLTELVRREAGIVLAPARARAILAAVRRAAPGLDPGALVRAASDPGGDRGLVNRLIDEVAVRETAFARDRAQFDAIAWASLQQAAAAARSPAIRVWSAGCASGEEAYTLAMFAAEAFAPGPPPVDVLGTDISGTALAMATAGRYGGRALRAVDTRLRARYLDQQPDGSYQVTGRLRRLVRFRRHNLARDAVPPPGEAGFDLVICRNVLIYFDEALAARVVDGLRRSLRPGGVLLLGHADALRPGPGCTAGEPEAGGPGPSRRAAGPPSRAQRLAGALDAAGRDDRDVASGEVSALLADDPLDADAHFIDGLAALAAGRPALAVAALRRALCADASFSLAAFALGRAFDALGDQAAARRSYAVALRTLDPADPRHGPLLQQTGVGDVAAACRSRLGQPTGGFARPGSGLARPSHVM